MLPLFLLTDRIDSTAHPLAEGHVHAVHIASTTAAVLCPQPRTAVYPALTSDFLLLAAHQSLAAVHYRWGSLSRRAPNVLPPPRVVVTVEHVVLTALWQAVSASIFGLPKTDRPPRSPVFFFLPPPPPPPYSTDHTCVCAHGAHTFKYPDDNIV